jgi:hypothetical protein
MEDEGREFRERIGEEGVEEEGKIRTREKDNEEK